MSKSQGDSAVTTNSSKQQKSPGISLRRLLDDYRWAPFLLPLFVYMLLGGLGPETPGSEEPVQAKTAYGEAYLWNYVLRVAVVGGLLTLFAPVYRQWPLRVSPLALGVGTLGAVLWIGIHALGVEVVLVDAIGSEHWLIDLLGMGPRDAFNPIEAFGAGTTILWLFLAVRFAGLALIVPIVEELMLRGWLMRHLATSNEERDFWQVPFGVVTTFSVVMGTAFPMLYHPEKIAALVWFSLVTWLMVKTKNFWDCVAAHAVTNLLLGVWVVVTGDWELW